jgi:hypothetical protein
MDVVIPALDRERPAITPEYICRSRFLVPAIIARAGQVPRRGGNSTCHIARSGLCIDREGISLVVSPDLVHVIRVIVFERGRVEGNVVLRSYDADDFAVVFLAQVAPGLAVGGGLGFQRAADGGYGCGVDAGGGLGGAGAGCEGEAEGEADAGLVGEG